MVTLRRREQGGTIGGGGGGVSGGLNRLKLGNRQLDRDRDHSTYPTSPPYTTTTTTITTEECGSWAPPLF